MVSSAVEDGINKTMAVPFQRGQPIQVTERMFENYRLAAYYYMVVLKSRVKLRSGQPQTEQELKAIQLGECALTTYYENKDSLDSVKRNESDEEG